MSFIAAAMIMAALAMLAVAVRFAFFAIVSALAPLDEPPAHEPNTRFCVLVPAHNESRNLLPTLSAARALDYPAELFRVVVLADNCTDDTAAIAREAGVPVVERHDRVLTGKGEALRWFIANHRAPDEAVMCCDADSRPAPDYLRWMDRALAQGWGGAQGFNGTANPDASGLAALAAITGGMKNAFHYGGKAAVGLSCPLMNGWTLAATTLQAHPWRAFGVAEDFEQTLRLVDEGVRIRFVPQAKILSHKVSSLQAAAAQKERWSGGQSQVAKQVAKPLLWRALRECSLAKADAALDLLLPGYAPTTAVLALIASAGWLLFSPAHAATGLALAGLLLMAAQFAAGLTQIRWTAKTAAAVALAPVYVFWKLSLALKAAVIKPTRWRRAQRD